MIIFLLLLLLCTLYLIKRYKNNNASTYKQISYNELLKTQEWKDKRTNILNRDNNKCAYCGNTHNLQVHHKYYSKFPNGLYVYPWNYPDDALITLCDDCHKKVHSKKQIKTYYRRYSNNY